MTERHVRRRITGGQADAHELRAHRQESRCLDVEGERAVLSDLTYEGVQAIEGGDCLAHRVDRLTRFVLDQAVEQTRLGAAILRQGRRSDLRNAVDQRLEAELLEDADDFWATQF